MAEKIATRRGKAIDFTCPIDQDQILAWLYSKVVNFEEKAVRYAVRLDRDWGEDDESGPLLDFLTTAPEESDPLIKLLGVQECAETLGLINRSYSQAAAYVILLYRFGLDIDSLAADLRIVVGTLRVRIEGSVVWLQRQPSLFDGRQSVDHEFIPTRARGFVRRACTAVPETGQLAWAFG